MATTVGIPLYTSRRMPVSYNRKSYLRIANEERQMMTSLAKNVATNEPYSFKDMLLLSQSLAPSQILSTGGFLMELYIIRYGKRGDSKYLCDAKTLVHPSIMDNLVGRYGFPFWFHLISKIGHFIEELNPCLLDIDDGTEALADLGDFSKQFVMLEWMLEPTIVGENLK